MPRERYEDRVSRQMLEMRQCPTCGQKLRNGRCYNSSCPSNPDVAAAISEGAAPPQAYAPVASGGRQDVAPGREANTFAPGEAGWGPPPSESTLPPQMEGFRTAELLRGPLAGAPPAPQVAPPEFGSAAGYGPNPYGPPNEYGQQGYGPPNEYGQQGYGPNQYGPNGPNPYGPNGPNGPNQYGQQGYGPNPYGPPGYAPAGYPAPRPPKSGHGGWLIAGAVALVLIIGLASVLAFGQVTAFTSSGTKAAASPPPVYPTSWDPRVQAIVNFVQQDRGLTFKHPVAVSFLPDNVYVASLNQGQPTPSASSDTNETSFYRALGLIQGTADLNTSGNQLQDDGTLAYYSYTTKSISVRGTTLSVATQVTLSHELTHALQDQYFDLNRVNAMPDEEASAFRMLYEGDAVRVQNDYEASLSAADQAAYATQSQAQDSAATSGLASVPPALQTMFGEPYVLGPEFVAALLAQGGNATVDNAFRNPPIDEAQVFNPWVYLDNLTPDKVAKPSVPKGAKSFDSGTIDAATWFIILTQRIAPAAAIQAADAWNGDTYVVYTQGGRSCVKDNVVATSAQGLASMQAALTQWAQAAPAGTASVAPGTNDLVVSACDPGTTAGTAPVATAQDAFVLPVARTEFVLTVVKEGATTPVALCAGTKVVETYSLADLEDPSGAAFTTPAGVARLEALIAPCKTSPQG
jgi:hypothetical protein